MRLVRLLAAPEQLYMLSLASTGFATLITVALPAAARGVLAAVIVSATLGAAIGSFSIDTFLLSRPAGWVADRGRWWVVCLTVGSVLLSAGAAAAITAIDGLGSYPISMAGAGALTVFNAAASMAMRRARFVLVYAIRACVGLVFIGCYAILIATGDRGALRWSTVWLLGQLLGAAALLGVVLLLGRDRTAPLADPVSADPVPAGPVPAGAPPSPAGAVSGGRGDDLLAMGRLHLGICAQMVTFRMDQVLLARFAGAKPLGVYALAVAAMEFAQAGGVVAGQRILADRDSPSAARHSVAPVVRSALAVAVLAVAGLAAIGFLTPQYGGAWLMGLLLLPGCLAVTAGKAWSARLLKLRGEQATTWVALATLAVAVPAYLIAVPWQGALGACVASSLAYAVHALLTRRGLSRRAEPHLVQQAA
jgi:hypothetical protein